MSNGDGDEVDEIEGEDDVVRRDGEEELAWGREGDDEVRLDFDFFGLGDLEDEVGVSGGEAIELVDDAIEEASDRFEVERL